LASKGENLRLRARLVHAIRRFFVDQGYLEIETPHLIPAPAPEVHIDAVKVGDMFLHTSPELCMKRLLSAGYPKIFQICKCFRKGERGKKHLPEFTLLEWYRVESDYVALMDECEEMILAVSRDLGFGKSIIYRQRHINLERPWERISVQEAFNRYGSISMEQALKKGCFDELLVEEIEPHLGISGPVFLYDYPASFAALAKLKEEAPNFVERFEIYMGGLELANAFSELTDAEEQKTRFERDRRERERLGKEAYPFPKEFLESLSDMPSSAGIALGVDRLAMIFADATKIDDVVSFAPEEL
jgi:lysyl-tRNA synthetase class 2